MKVYDGGERSIIFDYQVSSKSVLLFEGIIMTESDNGLNKKIQEWLESQGYPLEMLVARAFRQTNAKVQQSSYYLDPETEKSREIDVRTKSYRLHKTMWGLIELQLFFLIECKSQQKHPWILFSGGPNKQSASLRPPTSADGRVLLNWFEGDIHKSSGKLLNMFEDHSSVCYGVTQAFTAGKDVPYEAIMSAAKAAVAEIIYYEKLNVKYPNDEDIYQTHLKAQIAIPAVITDAPLFQCYLDENDALIIERVDSGLVEWKYLFGDYSKLTGIPVYIYTVQAIDTFVNYAKNLENQLYDFLPHFMKELHERQLKNKKENDIS